MKRGREESVEEIAIQNHLHAVRKAKATLDQMLSFLERVSAGFATHRLDDDFVGTGYPSSTFRQEDSAQATGVFLKSKTKQTHMDSYNKSAQTLRATLELMKVRLLSTFNSAYALNRAEATLTSKLNQAEVKAEEERVKKQQKRDEARHQLENQELLARELAPYSAHQRK